MTQSDLLRTHRCVTGTQDTRFLPETVVWDRPVLLWNNLQPHTTGLITLNAQLRKNFHTTYPSWVNIFKNHYMVRDFFFFPHWGKLQYSLRKRGRRKQLAIFLQWGTKSIEKLHILKCTLKWLHNKNITWHRSALLHTAAVRDRTLITNRVLTGSEWTGQWKCWDYDREDEGIELLILEWPVLVLQSVQRFCLVLERCLIDLFCLCVQVPPFILLGPVEVQSCRLRPHTTAVDLTVHFHWVWVITGL